MSDNSSLVQDDSGAVYTSFVTFQVVITGRNLSTCSVVNQRTPLLTYSGEPAQKAEQTTLTAPVIGASLWKPSDNLISRHALFAGSRKTNQYRHPNWKFRAAVDTGRETHSLAGHDESYRGENGTANGASSYDRQIGFQ